jgi:hypothetical protein
LPPLFWGRPYPGSVPYSLSGIFYPAWGFFFLFTSPRPTLKWKEEKLRNCTQPVNRLRGWEMREIYFSYSSKMKRNNSDKILRTVLHPLCMDGSHLFCARPLVTAAALVADAQCCLAACVSLSASVPLVRDLLSSSLAICSFLRHLFLLCYCGSDDHRADVVRNSGKKNSFRKMQERAKANDIM